MNVLNYGISKQFYDRYNPEDVLQQNHLDFEHILDDIQTYNINSIHICQKGL